MPADAVVAPGTGTLLADLLVLTGKALAAKLN